MDWMKPVDTNLWVFPAGLRRSGAAKVNPLSWTSKYGSVVAAGYDKASADGINEKGLVANLLYLGDAQYGKRDPERPGLSVVGWAQYVLDQYATVDEAVKALKEKPFQLVGVDLPHNFQAALHLAISDSGGDSAIFEYLDGELFVHHGRQYTVMTNEPRYDQQLALNTYWRAVGGEAMLPGTDRPEDRFVRASYYLGKIPNPKNINEGLASVFSVIRNVSVPYMTSSQPDRPNVAPTLWRTVIDQKHLVYYFESSAAPNVFWVDLNKVKLKTGSPVLRLKIDKGEDATMVGEVSSRFEPAKPYEFMLGKD